MIPTHIPIIKERGTNMTNKTILLGALLALCVAFNSAYATADLQNLDSAVKSAEKSVKLKLEEDYDAVLAAAKKDRKYIFLEFSGLDWCPPCKMLHRFVINTEKFAKYANEKLHAMIVDFSRDGEPKNAKFAQKHIELAQKYSLVGFPMVLIIDPDGNVVDTMVGMGVKTPEEMIAKIEAAKKK